MCRPSNASTRVVLGEVGWVWVEIYPSVCKLLTDQVWWYSCCGLVLAAGSIVVVVSPTQGEIALTVRLVQLVLEGGDDDVDGGVKNHVLNVNGQTLRPSLAHRSALGLRLMGMASTVSKAQDVVSVGRGRSEGERRCLPGVST